MSSIAQYLQSIRNAIYARTVRNDIANAIEQCYDDVHNPTLNTEAMQAAVQAKIDAGQMAALTIGDGTITAAKLASGVIDNTLATSGAAADAKKTGDEIAAVKADLDALEPGLSNAAKAALLNCFAHVAWTDENGQEYYDALEDAIDPGEDYFPIIYVHRGVGTSNHVQASVANRALSDPIPFENKIPITAQINLDNTVFGYNFKFTDINDEFIDNDKLMSPEGDGVSMCDESGQGHGGFTTDNNILLTLKRRNGSSLQASKMGVSSDSGRVPDNHFCLLFANASNTSSDLPNESISGTVTVQGITYRLVTSE